MSKKKIGVIVGVILIVVVFVIIADRKLQILSIGYGSLSLDNEYTEIKCEYLGKTEVYESIEDIERYIKELNSMEIREKDWLDDIVNPSLHSGKDSSEIKCNVTFTLTDGSTELLSYEKSENGRLYYDEKTYIIKD